MEGYTREDDITEHAMEAIDALCSAFGWDAIYNTIGDNSQTYLKVNKRGVDIVFETEDRGLSLFGDDDPKAVAARAIRYISRGCSARLVGTDHGVDIPVFSCVAELVMKLKVSGSPVEPGHGDVR